MTTTVLRLMPSAPGRWPSGPRTRAAGFAIGAVLLWSTWPTLAAWTQPAPPLLVFGLAAAIGFCVMMLRAMITGKADSFLAIRPITLVFVALALLANNVLFLLAMPRIGPAEANVIAYLWPVLLTAMGAITGRSGLTALQGTGIGISFIGAAIVIGPSLGAAMNFPGIALAFASGLVFAIYALIRSYGREPQDVVGPSMGLIALICLPTHIVFEPETSLTLTQLMAIAGIGIAPLSLSNMLWDQAGRTGQLPLISAIAYLTPLGALLLLALSGAAAVTWVTLGGAAFIVAGAFAAANFFKTTKGSRS